MRVADRTEGRRRRRTLPALVVVNGLLLCALGAVTFAPSARAQPRAARADYTMISGGVHGSNTGAVYVVDTTNQEMLVMTWDTDKGELVGVGYRNLAADAAAVYKGPGR